MDILHRPINENACLRVSETPFSVSRRKTPAYSKLLAISNKYGYMVSGTPKGLSVFKTADAEDELVEGKSKGTNTAIMLETRKEIDLSHHSLPTHVGISADETHILVMTMVGKLLVFPLSGLVEKGADSLIRAIDITEEARDMKPNPQALPNTVAVLTLDGEVLMVDFTTGAANTIVPIEEDTFVTAICWSRKGKQIVCGDTNARLIQRLPTDGTVKRIIPPQEDDGNIGGECAILAVDWISTYSFFVVYGQIPDGAFIPGNGGGGDGEGLEEGKKLSDGEYVSLEDDGFEDNMTAAYVISQENKKLPMQWMFVDDPCSSMMCPARYPGFLIACVSEWGPSTENILVMAGTSSDATMTIGHTADSGGTFEWGQWDFDGDMAVMPLSALDDCPNAGGDTYPIGIAVDYTGHCMLPPVEDDGDSVKPVPILWILNTDGCLLGYHIYNVLEMRQGTRSSNMVDKVMPLSESPSASTASVPAFASGKAFVNSGLSSGEKEKTKEPDAGLPKAFASSAFGSGGSLTSGVFGASNSFAPSFGKSSGVTPIVKPPTSMGLTGQHVFGSSGSGKPSTSFSGFAASTTAEGGSEGKSIFDTSSSGPSIFDPVNTTKAASASFDSIALGAADTKDPAPFASVASKTKEETSVFGPAANVPSSVPFGGAVATANPSQASQSSNMENLFGNMSSTLDNSKGGGAFGSLSRSGMPSIGMFGSAKSSTLAGAKHTTSGNSSGTEMQPTKRWDNKATPAVGTPTETGSTSPVLSKPTMKTVSGLLAKSQTNAKAKEEEERKRDQERLDAIQHELEEKSQDLIKRQFISTCNLFDGRLRSLASVIKSTGAAITQVRETYLPNIPLNQAVLDMAGDDIQNGSLAIDDTKSWNCIAGVLLEALQVSSEELRTSQDSLSKQLAGYLKIETKREEISRILESAASASASPNATVDGGLNPLQRDYQRRLKHSLEIIDRRYASVEQVVTSEAARIGNECGSDSPKTMGAPTTDSVRRTLQNVATTLCQRNFELDELSDLVGSMNLDSGGRSVWQQNDGKEQDGREIHSSLFKTDNSPGSRDESSELWRTAETGGNPPSVRGFGLRFEDLIVSDRMPEKKDSKEAEPSNNPCFPHTKIRELKPRKSTRMSQRRTSLLHDTSKDMGNTGADGSITAPASIYSTASAYIQSRKQRTLVKDVLTRANRSVPLIRTSANETSDSFQLGTAEEPILAPMPNLERYVQAFGKLKIETPVSEPKDEWEFVSKADEQPTLDIFQPRSASLDQWTCSLCQLKNPNSATSCNICEAARPGATTLGLSSTTGKDLSFGAAAQNTQSQSSVSAPFPSFVPPTGKPPMFDSPLAGSVDKDSLAASLFGSEPKPTSTNLLSEDKPPYFSMSMFVPPKMASAVAADVAAKQEEVDSSSHHSASEPGDIDEEDEVTYDTESVDTFDDEVEGSSRSEHSLVGPDIEPFEAPVVNDDGVGETDRYVGTADSAAGSFEEPVIVENEVDNGTHSEQSTPVVSEEKELVDTGTGPLEEPVVVDKEAVQDDSAKDMRTVASDEEEGKLDDEQSEIEATKTVGEKKREGLVDAGTELLEDSVDDKVGDGTLGEHATLLVSKEEEEGSVDQDTKPLEEPVVVDKEEAQDDSDKDVGTAESEDVGTTESPIHVEHSEAEEANSEDENDGEVVAAAGSQESDGFVHVSQDASLDVGNDNTPEEQFPSDTESKIHSAVSEELDRNVTAEGYHLDDSLAKLLGGVDVNVLTATAMAPKKSSDMAGTIALSSPDEIVEIALLSSTSATVAAAPPLCMDSLAIGENNTSSSALQKQDQDVKKQSQTTTPPVNKKDTASSSPSSFFRPGRLGKFGGSKPSQAAVLSTSSKDDNGLPSAFLAQSMSTSTPAFGSKLGRPAFGVASMSSYGDASKKLASGTAKVQSGFGSMGRNSGSGFGAMTSPDHNPFAAYNGNGDDKSIFDDSKGIVDQPKSKMASYSLTGSPPPEPTAATASEPKSKDPIMDIINGSDVEVADNDDYDSE